MRQFAWPVWQLPAACLVFLLLTVAGYGAVLNNYFFLDDTGGVFAGYLLSHDIGQIFTHKFETIYMSNLWRVVDALSFVPNYWISGLDPWSYYAVSLLLHAGAATLLFHLTRRLSGDATLAALTSFVFCLAANKSDAVMMVAHRTTLLGAFFGLLTVDVFASLLLDGFSYRRLSVLLLAFAAALGSYETSLMLPAVMLALGFVYQGPRFFKGRLALIAVVLLVVSLTLIIVLHLNGTQTAVPEQELIHKAFHMFRNIVAVVPALIIPPYLLQPARDGYYSTLTHFGLIEWGGLGILCSIALINLRLKDRMVWFGLLTFLILAVPTTGVNWLYFPDINLPHHRMRWSIGKFSYLSSCGFYLAALPLIYQPFKHLAQTAAWRKGMLGCAAALLLVYASLNLYWLHQREKTWELITEGSRLQVAEFRALNFVPPLHIPLFFANFNFYGNHGRNMLRAMLENPGIELYDLNTDTIPSDRNSGILINFTRPVRIQWINN